LVQEKPVGWQRASPSNNMTSSGLGTKGNKPAATCNVEVEEKENSCQSAETTKVRSAVQIRNSDTKKVLLTVFNLIQSMK